jgi:hypothetical protein
VGLLHGGAPWICNSRAMFLELELCQNTPLVKKNRDFYGVFVVLGSIEKYCVVLRSIKHFDIPTIKKLTKCWCGSHQFDTF